MFRCTVLHLVIAATTGCPMFAPGNSARDPVRRQDQRVVFTAEQTSRNLENLRSCEGDELTGHAISDFWTPSFTMINPIDRRVRLALDSTLRSTRRASDHRAVDYVNQYFGLVIDRREVILVNGIHTRLLRSSRRADSLSHEFHNWRAYPVVICDAGVGRFRTVYDPGNDSLAPIRFADSLGGHAGD